MNGTGDTDLEDINESVYVLFYEKEDKAECTQYICDIDRNDSNDLNVEKLSKPECTSNDIEIEHPQYDILDNHISKDDYTEREWKSSDEKENSDEEYLDNVCEQKGNQKAYQNLNDEFDQMSLDSQMSLDDDDDSWSPSSGSDNDEIETSHKQKNGKGFIVRETEDEVEEDVEFEATQDEVEESNREEEEKEKSEFIIYIVCLFCVYFKYFYILTFMMTMIT